MGGGGEGGGRISGRFYDESGGQYRFFGSAEKKK